MKKKDFSQINAEPIYNMITESTDTGEPAPEDFEEAPAADPAADPAAGIAAADADQAAAEQAKQKRGPRTFHDGTTAEDRAALENMQTGGRKGLKLPRINMAFTPDVFDYINTMSVVSGLNKTEFVNKVVKEHMKNHADLYEQALKFRNSL